MIDLLVVLDLDLVYSISMGKFDTFDQINGNNGFNVLFMILFLYSYSYQEGSTSPCSYHGIH